MKKVNVSRYHRRQKLVKAHFGKDHRYGFYYYWHPYSRQDRKKRETLDILVSPADASPKTKYAAAVLLVVTVPPIAFLLMYLFL